MTSGRSRRMLTLASVLLFVVFVVEVVRTATMSSFVEFDPPVDLDLRTFPGAWQRLGDLQSGSEPFIATLALLIAAIASPRGVRSRPVIALACIVGLLVSTIAVAALTAGPGGVPWNVAGRSVGFVVAYWALAVGAWRGIATTTDSPSTRQVRSRRGSTGFGILKEYE